MWEGVAVINDGDRVRVHYNLHRGDFSVVDPKSGRVIANVETVTLRDATFRVQPAAREKVLVSGRRSVHAYVIGFVTNDVVQGGTRVTYNPHRAAHFHVADTGAPVSSAERVTFRDAYCYVSA